MNHLASSVGIIHIGLFISAVMLLNLTPGPDTAYIVTRSVAQGPLAGVWSALGISLGCCVHTMLCALGLTALLAASAAVFVVIKVVGAVYLIGLGVRMWSATRRGSLARPAAVALAGGKTVRGARQLLLQGFFTNVFNPKVLLFFVAFFPQFIDREARWKAISILALGAIMILMSTIYNCLVGWLAGGITTKLRSLPQISVWLERTVAIGFIGLGSRLLLLEAPK